MTTLHIPRCYQCSAPLPPRPPGTHGPPRRFCSDRCRKAFSRARRHIDLEPALAFAYELPALPPTPSPDELTVRAVLEAKDAAATLARLAPVVRRNFSWRCERAAIEITRTIDDYFPGV